MREILTAVGAYQLMEVLASSRRLTERKIPHTVVCLLEPGQFLAARSKTEQAHQASPEILARLVPTKVLPRLFVMHTRPETMLGVLGPLHTGAHTGGLGYSNHGGTLITQGLSFVNRSSWVHILAETARLVEFSSEMLLSQEEREMLSGRRGEPSNTRRVWCGRFMPGSAAAFRALCWRT